jgi:hypothetical protein
MSKSKEEYVEATLNQFLESENAWEISLSDIVVSDQYRELCPTPDSCSQDDLDKILYLLGMDTNVLVKRQTLQHRNWRGQVVNCLRFVGNRRQDKEWLRFLNGTNKYQNK